MTRRAQPVCDSPDSLQDDTDHLNFVRRNTHSNTDRNSHTNVNSVPVTAATTRIPYIKSTSETIASILQPYNIRVAHKPITALRRLLTNVKDKDKPVDCLQSAFSLKIRLVLDLIQRDCKPRCYYIALRPRFSWQAASPLACLGFACSNFAKKNKRLLAVQQTGRQTGSSVQDQMLGLPGYLHWRNRQ